MKKGRYFIFAGILVLGLSVWAALSFGGGASFRLKADKQPHHARLVRIPLDRDQSFYTTAYVNDVPIRFAIDTGAAVTVLRTQDAARAGFALKSSDFSSEVRGIAASAATAEIKIDQLRLGTIIVQNLRAEVEDGNLDVSLLGQNFISRINRVVIEDGVMTLEDLHSPSDIRIVPAADVK